ncbi:MAG: DNRLRE domain-containing protein [Candidatus Brockarchaeota archaeon]|nr:DNRLRE domain-containing protein [Candidatus Brockarchaeota archaeon]
MKKEKTILLFLFFITISFLTSLTQGEENEEAQVFKRFYPSDDAYVSSLYPDDNYGDKEYIGIKVETMFPTDIWRSYVKFNLETLPPGSSIFSATLWLYVYKPPSRDSYLECYLVSKDWVETAITWNNQPEVTEYVGSAQVKEGDERWVLIDVKSSIIKFTSKDASGYAPNYGWRLNDQGEKDPVMYAMYSKEAIFIPPADYKPRLDVVYYAPHLDLLISSSSMEAGSWVKMSVYRKTVDGESITRGSLRVKLSSSSTSPNKKFALTPEGSTITELTIPDGSDHRDFYYYDEKAGTWEIHVWTEQYSPYGDDTELITVNPGPLKRFIFDTISSPKIVMEPFTITITAYDAYENIKTDYTGTNSLSDTTGTIEPRMTGAFVNGKWIGDVVIKKVAKNVRITTRGAGKSGESNAFDVKAGPPAKIFITPSSFTMNAGELYSYLNVSLRDANGFETIASSTITVSLSTSSPKGEFIDCDSGGKVTRIYIMAGSGWATVCYNDAKHGTWTISASATGLTAGTSTVTVTADITPPSTTIAIGSPKHYVGNNIYVNSSTSFSLSASDDVSGVEETKYRIDDGPWKDYTGKFNLSGYSDGIHEIRYYSIDKAGNNEAEKMLTVILDNTPPSIEDPSPIESINQKTSRVTFTVTVEDPGSGVKEVRLIVDGAYQGLMTKSGNNYTKTISLSEGDHSWRVEAIDNLGNSRIQDYSLVFIVDDTPPTIFGLSGPSAPAWGESTVVSCQVSDDKSGVRKVTLYYSTDGGASWSSISMSLVGNRYSASIPSQPPFARIKYYVEASDNVGNTSQTNISEYTVGLPTWLYIAIVLIAIAVITAVLFSLRRKLRPRPSLPVETPEPRPEEPPTSAWRYPVEEVPKEPQEPVLPSLDYRSKIYEEIKLPFEEKREAKYEESYEQPFEEATPEEEEAPSIFEEEQPLRIEEKKEEEEQPRQIEEDLEP